jgi:hypothetical protein
MGRTRGHDLVVMLRKQILVHRPLRLSREPRAGPDDSNKGIGLERERRSSKQSNTEVSVLDSPQRLVESDRGRQLPPKQERRDMDATPLGDERVGVRSFEIRPPARCSDVSEDMTRRRAQRWLGKRPAAPPVD